MKTRMMAACAVTVFAFSMHAAYSQENTDSALKRQRPAQVVVENQCVSQALIEHAQISQRLLEQERAALAAATGFTQIAVAMRREKERYCFAASQCLKLPEPQNSRYFEDCLVKTQ